MQSAIRALKREVKDLVVITDVCLCEYTSHGHCGIVEGDDIVNDVTVMHLAQAALSHAVAGADIVAPSDMMDGRVAAIRRTLDERGFEQTAIMSYAAKYCSGFYGPFREAADSTPQFGDRRSHQLDPANVDEALREVEIDIAEGADIILVKPALPYLDVLSKVKERFGQPTAAYQVSGEYSMLKAAAQNGWLDEQRVMFETLTSIRRAGADMIITYYAREASRPSLMKKPVKSQKLFSRASQILPGGVDSPVRAFQAVGGTPHFIRRGAGAIIEDVDGNRFIDYVMSWGPLIHGHAPRPLIKAITAAAKKGTSFGAPSALEHELGEAVRSLVPSMERVRFVSSGTEATMSAIRLARAFTGRDRIIKFEGCYHGHGDAFLVKAGSGAMTLGIPTSPGVPAPVAADTLLARYNDLASVDSLLAAQGASIAALIIEPIAGNIGVVPPVDGFLAGLERSLPQARHPADLRRGDLGLPRLCRWRARSLRHRSRSHMPRQDHRRRPACRRVRRPRRHHEQDRACRSGVSGRDVVGKSCGDDCGALGAEESWTDAVSKPRATRGCSRGGPCGCGARRRRAASGQRVRIAAHAVLHVNAGA